MVTTQDRSQEGERAPRRFQPEMATAKIVERRDLTEDLWIVKLEPSIPFPFKPGQYCTIGAEGIERPYSIVSAPEEPLLELFVELVPPPDGQLTPVLYKLDIGTELTLRPKPKGHLHGRPQGGYACVCLDGHRRRADREHSPPSPDDGRDGGQAVPCARWRQLLP